MGVRMLFVIGAPRSGTTLLERMLASHSMILGGPEPHLLTPLAHLGVWAKVDKAPYDAVLAAEAQRLFVEALPNKEQDYWDACRAYCEVLYGRRLAAAAKKGEGAKRICLDKTPAYALVLPFITKVFPDAAYVILTRHPAAIFVSYANSFFDGDYRLAHDYNPILHRYVPAIAAFLRQDRVPFVHVRYEDLVQDPESWMRRILDHIGAPFEPQTIVYGNRTAHEPDRKGLGDPIGVDRYTEPTTESVAKWADELAADPAKCEFVQEIIRHIDPEDLRTFGYPPEDLWKPLEAANGRPPKKKTPPLNAYRLKRKLLLRLRRLAQKRAMFWRLLRKLRLACDVLLRE